MAVEVDASSPLLPDVNDAAPPAAAAAPETAISVNASSPDHLKVDLASSPTIPSRKSSLKRTTATPTESRPDSMIEGSSEGMISADAPQAAARVGSFGDYAFPAPPSRDDPATLSDVNGPAAPQSVRKMSIEAQDVEQAGHERHRMLPADGAGLGLAAVDTGDNREEQANDAPEHQFNESVGNRDSGYAPSAAGRSARAAGSKVTGGMQLNEASWQPLPRFIRGLVVANFEPVISHNAPSTSVSTPLSARIPISAGRTSRTGGGGGSSRRNRTRSTATITARNSIDFSLPPSATRSDDERNAQGKVTTGHRRTGSQSSAVSSANGRAVNGPSSSKHRRTGSQRSVGSELVGGAESNMMSPGPTIPEELDVVEESHQGNVFQQSLELGQEVYAFEQCQLRKELWYRGYVVVDTPVTLREPRNIWGQRLPDADTLPSTPSSSVFLGIFPARCIHPVEEIDDREGKLARGTGASEHKESPPLPMVVSSRRRSPGADPFVEDLSAVIKAYTARLPFYLQQRKYALFRSTTEHVQHLLRARRQLAQRLLTAVEAAEVRKACVIRLAQCAYEQGLPQAVLHSDGRRAQTGPSREVGDGGWVTPLRYHAMFLATAYLATSLASGFTPNADDERRSRIAHLYLDRSSTQLLSISELKAASHKRHDTLTLAFEIKAIVGKLCAEGEELELMFSLYDLVRKVSLTEDYTVVFNHFGSPVDPSRNKATFRDLEASRQSQIYLIVRAVRLVPYKRLSYSSRTSASWTTTFIRKPIGCGVNLMRLDQPEIAATEDAIAMFRPQSNRDFASCHEDIIQNKINAVRPITDVKLVVATQTCEKDSPAQIEVLPLTLTAQASSLRPRDWVYIKFWQNTLPVLNGDAHVGCTVALRDAKDQPIANALHVGGSCNPPADSVFDPVLDGSLLAVQGKYVDQQPSSLFLTFFSIAQTGVNGEPEQRVWATARLPLQDASTGNALAEGAHRLQLVDEKTNVGTAAQYKPREHLDLRVQIASSRLMSGFLTQLLRRDLDDHSDALRLLSFLDAKELALHADDILQRLLVKSSITNDSQSVQVLDAIAATLLAQRQAFEQPSAPSPGLVSKTFAAATPLLNAIQRVLKEDAPERNRVIQVLPALFGLVVLSVQNPPELPSSVIAHTISEIRDGIDATLSEVVKLLRESDRPMLASQVLLLEHYPLQAISAVFSPEEISEAIAGICDAIRSKAGQKIVEAKFGLMQRCLDLFRLGDQLRTELAPVFISHVKSQLELQTDAVEPTSETIVAINTLIRLSDSLTYDADLDSLEYLLSSALLPVLRFRSRLASIPVTSRNMRQLSDQYSFVGAFFAPVSAHEVALDDIETYVWSLTTYAGRERLLIALQTAWETSLESDTAQVILDFARDSVGKSLASTEADRRMTLGAVTALLWCLTKLTTHERTRAGSLQVIAGILKHEQNTKAPDMAVQQESLEVLQLLLSTDKPLPNGIHGDFLGSVVRLTTSDQDAVRMKAISVLEVATAVTPADQASPPISVAISLLIKAQQIRPAVAAEVTRLLGEKTADQIMGLLFLLRAEVQRSPSIAACLKDCLDQVLDCLPAAEAGPSPFAAFFSLTDVVNVLKSLGHSAAEVECLQSLRFLLRDEPVNWAFAAWEEADAQERAGLAPADRDIPLRYAALNALTKAEAWASALRKSIELERLQEENGQTSHQVRARSLRFRSELHARMSSVKPRCRFYLVQFADDIDCPPFVTMTEANKLVSLLGSSFEHLSIHLGAPSKDDTASCWVTSLEPLYASLPEASVDPWSMTTNVKRFCYSVDADGGKKTRHIFRTQHALPYIVPFVRVVEQTLDELDADEVAVRRIFKAAHDVEDGIRSALKSKNALHQLSAVMAVALEADVSALPEDSQTSLAVEGALNKYALTLFKGIRVHREMSLNTDMERYHSELIKAFERTYGSMLDLDNNEDLHFAWEREPYLQATGTVLAFTREPHIESQKSYSTPTIASSTRAVDNARLPPPPLDDYVVINEAKVSEETHLTPETRPISALSTGTFSASVGSKGSMGKFRSFGFGSFRKGKGSSDSGSR